MMRAFLQRVSAHPFVSMSAFAALVHSTWSLGTMFSGSQPIVTAYADVQFGEWVRQTVQLCMWLAPALAIALAIDVGLVESAHAVRSGRAQRAAFAALALGSYFLQLIYIAHHFPRLELSTALSPNVISIVQSARDYAVLIVPALLQLPIVLYVFGGANDAAHADADAHALQIPTARVEHILVHEAPAPAIAPAPQMSALPTGAKRTGASGGETTGEIDSAVASAVHANGVYICTCPRCDMQVQNKNAKNLKRSLAAHMSGAKCRARIDALALNVSQEVQR